MFVMTCTFSCVKSVSTDMEAPHWNWTAPARSFPTKNTIHLAVAATEQAEAVPKSMKRGTAMLERNWIPKLGFIIMEQGITRRGWRGLLVSIHLKMSSHICPAINMLVTIQWGQLI